MRIIYITSSMPYGPREAFIISEVEEVRKQGHEVLIVPMYPRVCALSSVDCGRWGGKHLRFTTPATPGMLLPRSTSACTRRGKSGHRGRIDEG
jgi:hypothetical protein